MDYLQLIETLSPEIYQDLRRAVELGKWRDGRPLTAPQRANAMQAIIAWGERHLPPEQRVGYIDRGHKSGSQCDEPDVAVLAWRDRVTGQ